MKEQGGPWDCFPARNFYGWESEKLVAVTYGHHLVEQITRARTHLVVILAESASLRVCNADFGFDYLEAREHFQQAANEGLVDIVL